VQPLWKSVWRFLKKLKIDLPYDPTMPLLGIFLREYKSKHKRNTCVSMFIAALFTKVKLWNQTRRPTTNEWIKKKVVFIHHGVFNHKEIRLCHLQANGWNRRSSY
jgi:hypothetical protein